ncbi:MAG: hypothetical protein LBH76_07605, partial [Propionibacteriaceae bacterium]|nr:hypothetical protein [Propionibacteriaceae bacterium]
VPAKATASPELLVELLEGIQRRGAKFVPKDRKVAGASVGALGFSVGLTFNRETQKEASFRSKLTLLCQELDKHGKGVLLLVDEVTSDSPPIGQLAVAYQELVGEGRNVAIVMAGLPDAVSAVLNDKLLTFLNRATKLRLDVLLVSEVMVHYFQTFKELGKSIANDDLTRAAEATRGYPYLLQLVGYYLLQYAGDDPTITSSVVDLAIATARKALDDAVFRPALRPLSARDQAFLKAMAVDLGPSSVSEIARRLGVSPASAQQTRARLIGSGTITSVGPGQIEFALPYLAEHLRDEN